MHPERHRFLARRVSPKRRIVEKTWSPEEWRLTLECGHTVIMNANMQPDADTFCVDCGMQAVRLHPVYGKEFEELEEASVNEANRINDIATMLIEDIGDNNGMSTNE